MLGKIDIDGSGEGSKHAVTPSSEFRVQRDTVEYGGSTRARIASEKNELQRFQGIMGMCEFYLERRTYVISILGILAFCLIFSLFGL